LNPLDILLAEIASTAANAGARFDPDLADRLQAMNGRVMLIETTSPVNAWTVTVFDGQLQVETGETIQPNVIVRGSMADLISSLGGTLHAGVAIEGDEATLSEFQAAFAAFRPDVTKPIRNLFGDRTAEDLLGAAEVALNGLRSLVKGASETVRSEAATQFVTENDLDTWLDVLDDLKLRLDRLDARTSILDAARTPTSPASKGD
jgi:ubiquinone biosynthesis protein UbiJ